MKTSDYKNLLVWQKSIKLCVDGYKVLKTFPKDEMFALTTQMKKCCVSVPSNIAEGQARGSDKEFIHFLKIANGSLAELETQVILTKEIGYINEVIKNSALEQIKEISCMLKSLISHIERKNKK